MTLESLAPQLESRHREWATAHVAELDRVSNTPEVQSRITHFIEESARHPLAVGTGRPIEAVKACLNLSSLANFRLGLLIGLMIERPIDTQSIELPDPVPDAAVEGRCETCAGTGQICLTCGFPLNSTPSCTHMLEPVICEDCDGTGLVKQ